MEIFSDRNNAFLALVIAFSTLVGGCSNLPTAEIKVFRESVLSANAVSVPMLDELSITERRLKKRVAAAQKEPVFDPTQAGYFSDIGDAPAAANLRQAHGVLDRLSDVLLGLATGAGVQNDMADIENLASETTKVLNLFSSVVPGAAIAGTFIDGAADVSKPGQKFVLDELSRREARRFIDACVQQNVVKILIDRMIATTPEVFIVLVRDAERASRNQRISPEARLENAKAYADRKEKVRLVLSNYVVLLQRVNAAWDEAAKSATTRSTLSVSVLSERIIELRTAVAETRRAYAELHAD